VSLQTTTLFYPGKPEETRKSKNDSRQAVWSRLTSLARVEIALLTGCRAVDAYYIATTNHVNAALITNDRVMKYNALKVGVEAYYLLSDNDYSTLISKLIVS